jgi:hypothetical protein
MSHEIIDLSLPAHDPAVPKPRGLLPIPPEVEEAVAREEARIAREHGIRIAPEAKRRMLDQLTLQCYYEGAYVASRCTPKGVAVLAVGWDEAGKYLEDHPPETRQDVRIGTVKMSRLEIPLAFRTLRTTSDGFVHAELDRI